MAGISTEINMIDSISAVLYTVSASLVDVQQAFESMYAAADNEIDLRKMEKAQAVMESTTEMALGVHDQMKELSNITWNSPQNMDMFSGDSFARWQQEVNSSYAMMDQLMESQRAVSRQAESMKLLPDNALQDIDGMGGRLTVLQSQMEQFQQTRIAVAGVEQANTEMERLRQQFNGAQQAYDDMNSALQSMDVSAANKAYTQLNSIVSDMERNIRDNTQEQHSFNTEIRSGTQMMGGLQNAIMGAVAAYASMRGAGMALNLSDSLAQTTARLNLINDGLQTTEDLNNKIFLAAERSGGSYQAMADSVSKIGITAGEAFGSNDELIAFTEQLNKQFAIAGTNADGVRNVMLQITQALGSGVLRGDELNSVFEQAPTVIQTIADYLGVSIGQIREMAKEGEITADVMRNALLSATDDTNEAYESMPLTFANAATRIQDNALMAFQPVLQRLNEIANSEAFQIFAQNATNAIVVVAGVVMGIFDALSSVASFASENWSMLAPLIFGVVAALAIYNGYLIVSNTLQAISNGIAAISAARSAIKAGLTIAEAAATTTAAGAQVGLNAAILACPVTWIILAIIALIAVFYTVVAAINHFADESISATGLIFGAFFWLGSVIANIFMGLLDVVFGVINSIANTFGGLGNFLENFFDNPLSSIIYAFRDMADIVLGILQKIASAADFVIGTSMADAVEGWREGIKNLADEAVAKFAPDDTYKKVWGNLDLSVENTLGLERFDNTDAFAKGYNIGENVDEFFANIELFPDTEQGDEYPPYEHESTGYLADIASNTSDTVSIGEENLKYWRDIAERDAINRYTTAKVEVKFNGGIHNNVNADRDLDGIIRYITDGVEEAMSISAERAVAY